MPLQSERLSLKGNKQQQQKVGKDLGESLFDGGRVN